MVAETVFDSATLELRVPVATPLGSVSPAGCVSVFPLPAAASTTLAPLTGFPPASRAVTVIVAVPVPGRMDAGAAATVDCEADTGPAATLTVAVCVSAVPSAVAETVFGSATVELKAPVATPLASVGPVGCVSVFPAPVAASTIVAPLIGLPPASRTVTVMVALALPAGRVVGEAVRVDCDADTGAESTVTIAVCVSGAPSIVAEIVFVSATVEPSVPVATPLALVVPLGCVRVLPLPVAAGTTVAPLIGFPLASFAVTVIVAVPLPAVNAAGDALTVDCAAETAVPAPAVLWQLPLPASEAVCPATGTNCQVYVPSPSVSFSTPYVPLSRTSLFGRTVVPNTSTPCPPVPTVNCRIPFCGSFTSSGVCGANRSYSR